MTPSCEHTTTFQSDTAISRAMTLGVFDGVHLGHQKLLATLREKAQEANLEPGILTFANHPSTIVAPHSVKRLLCTIPHRLKLLEACQLRLIASVPFTPELSQLDPESFLKMMQSAFSLKYLVLGIDATLGKGRQGSHEVIASVAQHLGIETYFVDLVQEQSQKKISSTHIRTLIEQGELKQASELLGRPYSVYAPIIRGAGKGKSLGFATANLSIEDLCIPPLGVYAATVLWQGKNFAAIINIGLAPSIQSRSYPVLEVHMIDQDIDLYGQHIEVIFGPFLREEQRFPSKDALAGQIASDIQKVKMLS